MFAVHEPIMSQPNWSSPSGSTLQRYLKIERQNIVPRTDTTNCKHYLNLCFVPVVQT